MLADEQQQGQVPTFALPKNLRVDSMDDIVDDEGFYTAPSTPTSGIRRSYSSSAGDVQTSLKPLRRRKSFRKRISSLYGVFVCGSASASEVEQPSSVNQRPGELRVEDLDLDRLMSTTKGAAAGAGGSTAIDKDYDLRTKNVAGGVNTRGQDTSEQEPGGVEVGLRVPDPVVVGDGGGSAKPVADRPSTPLGDVAWERMSAVARDAMTLLWNSKYTECGELLQKLDDELSPKVGRNNAKGCNSEEVATFAVVANGLGFLTFLNAVLTFEEDAIEKATLQLGKTEKALAMALKHPSVVQWQPMQATALGQLVVGGQGSGSGWFKSGASNAVNIRKLNLEMMKADTSLLHGIVHIMEGRISSFLKAAYALRRGFKEFESILNTINNSPRVVDAIQGQDRELKKLSSNRMLIWRHQTEEQSVYHGARIGMSICSFMISLLPQRAQSVIAVFGVKGSRTESLVTMKDGFGSGSYKAPIAGYVLALCYVELLKYASLRVKPQHVESAEDVIGKCVTSFPESTLFKVVLSKQLRVSGNVSSAKAELLDVMSNVLTHDSAEKPAPNEKDSDQGKTELEDSLLLLCHWELCITNAVGHDFKDALRDVDELLERTRKLSNRVFYMYLRSCLLEEQIVSAADASASEQLRKDLETTKVLINSITKKNHFETILQQRVNMRLTLLNKPAQRNVEYVALYELLYYLQEFNESSLALPKRIVARFLLDQGESASPKYLANGGGYQRTQTLLFHLLAGKSRFILILSDLRKGMPLISAKVERVLADLWDCVSNEGQVQKDDLFLLGLMYFEIGTFLVAASEIGDLRHADKTVLLRLVANTAGLSLRDSGSAVEAQMSSAAKELLQRSIALLKVKSTTGETSIM